MVWKRHGTLEQPAHTAASAGSAAQRHRAQNSLVRYRPGLTQPAVAEATCHNRETLSAGRSKPQQGGASHSRTEPRSNRADPR
ncbi:hypothetical protein P7K49_029726 [Saguinus oedipus]|uniref:Uncharacterized protein n=1 Tax=Saguinus oedipus TaxID=9490 RepID=A0ABQ9U811_SAGOE|nr:hypothetical protein P7K49_029726 [Saguinus oedipus]